MVGVGATYAITENATFNVASIAGTVLMEMHLGKDGFGLNFGMGGTVIKKPMFINLITICFYINDCLKYIIVGRSNDIKANKKHAHW